MSRLPGAERTPIRRSRHRFGSRRDWVRAMDFVVLHSRTPSSVGGYNGVRTRSQGHALVRELRRPAESSSTRAEPSTGDESRLQLRNAERIFPRLASSARPTRGGRHRRSGRPRPTGRPQVEERIIDDRLETTIRRFRDGRQTGGVTGVLAIRETPFRRYSRRSRARVIRTAVTSASSAGCAMIRGKK